jgi:hypothetical protein
MRYRRIVVAASLFAIGLTLSGCGSFDPTEWFNTKKPLPGERKEVFPGGVPGVPMGVPPDLVKGYEPPREPPPPPPVVAEEKPKPQPKPRPKPKPRQAAAPRSELTGMTVGPRPSAQPAPAPWPSPQQSAGQAAPQQSQSVFPPPPPPPQR